MTALEMLFCLPAATNAANMGYIEVTSSSISSADGVFRLVFGIFADAPGGLAHASYTVGSGPAQPFMVEDAGNGDFMLRAEIPAQGLPDGEHTVNVAVLDADGDGLNFNVTISVHRTPQFFDFGNMSMIELFAFSAGVVIASNLVVLLITRAVGWK